LDCKDEIRIRGDHVTGKLSIAILSPARGVSFNDQISYFDVTKPTQPLEKCPITRTPSFIQFAHRGRGVNDRNPVDTRRLLRVRCERPCGRTTHKRNELLPPHSIPLAAEEILAARCWRLVAARSRVARAIRVLPTAVRGPVLSPIAISRGTAGLSDDPQHPIATSLKFIRHFDDVNP